MKLITDRRLGAERERGNLNGVGAQAAEERDPLAELTNPGRGFDRLQEDPGVPLPASEWERVSRWARVARSSFLRQGHREVLSLEKSMSAVEVALLSLEERKPHIALRYLRQAEIEVGRFDRATAGERGSKQSRGDSVTYGCSRAIENLKDTIGQCLRAIVSREETALIRARVSLEDAAMCVLAAAARQNN